MSPMSTRCALFCVTAVIVLFALGSNQHASRMSSTPTWSSTWASTWSAETKTWSADPQPNRHGVERLHTHAGTAPTWSGVWAHTWGSADRLFMMPPVGRGPAGSKPLPRARIAADLRDSASTPQKGPWKPPPAPVSKPGPEKLVFPPPAKYFYGRVKISMYPSELPEEEEVFDPSYPDGQSSVAAVQLPVDDTGDAGFLVTEDKKTGRHVVLLVEPGSPAERAGIQKGDVLRAVTCYTAQQEETKSFNLFYWSAEYTNMVKKEEHAYMITDKQPLYTVNSALASNAGHDTVNLVFERRIVDPDPVDI